ncbi:phosphoadenosine phosphosulfate reductase family protein [Jinshanibacter sp. LJY008]|uniref:Phosphoadenosine phosphosulfate reductase family protein n=2 Tax=Limnobaculum eriocheiris TaxID=2897391 RepID=A0A9X1SND1_9GAMM|nr:phosphoadenosine phosphosulfate reductase family protein [Limnobaculum eriocheiris]
MEQHRQTTGEDVRYVFMDTGAEHPKTYEFIRNVAKNWNIDLVCLRLVVNPVLKKANSYKDVSVDDIGYDLSIWRDICSKYGTPYVGGPFCTRTMKIEPFRRYCRDYFGNDFVSWIGLRRDEQRRTWGEKAYLKLFGMYFDNDVMHRLFMDLVGLKNPSDIESHLQTEYAFMPGDHEYLAKRIMKLKEKNERLLSEISDFSKQDILNWWKTQPFDLELPEHLGNCVFCIKKGINKIALATRDEPQLAEEFKEVIYSDSVRTVERRQQENKIMYRGNHSLESIIATYADHTRDEIFATIRGNGGNDSGSCSESCEAFACDWSQGDLFEEES